MAAPYPDCVPRLTDGVVVLRAHRPSDVDRLVEQCTDPLMIAYTTVPRPYAAADAQDFIAGAEAGWADPAGPRAWVVTDHSDDYLGTIDLRPHGPAYGVGYGLHPAGRGRGLAARALPLVCAWAFDHGAPLVRWNAFVGNWASRHTAWSCGFTIHGTDRGHVVAPTVGLVDTWVGSLVAGEPTAPARPWLRAPTLDGDRVRLRAFRDDDASQLPDEPDAAFGVPGVDAGPARAGFAAWLLKAREQAADGHAVQWCLADRHTDEVLGGLRLGGLAAAGRPGSAHLGYWLLPRHRGHGYLQEALDLVVTHAFAPAADGGLACTRLAADTLADNLPSLRALYAAGWRRCGTEGAPGGDRSRAAVVCLELLSTDDRQAQRRRPLALPVLQTERLRLRRWGPDDGPGPGDEPDEAALTFMPADAQPTQAGFADWLRRREAAQGTSLAWCLAERDTDRALGGVAIFGLDPGPEGFDGEVGYWLYPSARGRHAIAEILPRVLDHAFRAVADGGLGLARLHASIDAENEPSQAVLRGAGFRETGRCRIDWRRPDGTLSDSVYFELLATDPRGMSTHAAPASTQSPPAVGHAVK